MMPIQLQKLYELIKLAKSDEITIKDFCEQFERIYNLELDRKIVPKNELGKLAALFDKVVWYSPYEDERKVIPNYLGEEEIRQAIKEFDRNK
jgi:hypothetical protein